MKFFIRPQFLLYVVFCIVGVFNAFRPTIMSGFAYMQTDPGDTRLNHYFLEHLFQVIFNKNYTGELFSPAFFYPYKNVLTFSDNLFGSAPIYFILRAFFSLELSYQLWMIVVCVLCFVSFAVLMRYYKVGHVPAAIGAFLFAFGMPRVVKIGHQQLLPQFFTPLAFLFLWNFLRSPRNKPLAYSLLLIYFQVLAGIYLGWFLMFSLAIFTAITCLLDKSVWQRLTIYFKQNYKPAILITAIWLLLMLGLLGPYIKAKGILGSPSYTQVDSMLPRLSSWFLPAPDSLWWSLLSENSKHLPMAHEHHIFLGFLTILLTVLSIYTLLYRKNILNDERTLLIKICLLVALTIFIITLHVSNSWSIWRIVYGIVPGASVIRGVTRIWTMFYFYILVAVILCLDSILRTMLNQRLRMTAVSLLCIGCVLEQIVTNSPSFALAPLTKEVAQIQELMQKDCDVAYVTLKAEVPPWSSQLSAMWAGIKANIPVVNGYSGNVPPNYGRMEDSMSTPQLINWLGEDSRGQLCIISQKSLKNDDKLVSMYSVKENLSSSGNWTSYHLQLPISKIFSQKIEVYEIPKTVKIASAIKVPVVVKNISNFLWSTKGKHYTSFSYRWLDSEGKLAVFEGDGDRIPLPFDLSPGESAAINAVIKTPTKPGQYSLILTMLQEHVAWFNDKQAESPKFEVSVTSKS
ncbi:fungal specific transcription factor domain-containing protein [Brasilonema bromeliae]|uniref:Glycosyltransferase RgtA/B/C/D-like domain-containing protein n=1 Tax=Brasilonema bromeliae SPC951 TaxID=385972 RepID=A0ABX1PAJ6_9CYAN|nr:fungal transcription factor regulatory middle homology region domain-containing protein [Brasilonema bromeliae]NMG21319.1 hypothetical protein [Brasilonema bromeliae SPC951]